jgi:phosphoribosylformylglycinamidine cyclo-ligase
MYNENEYDLAGFGVGLVDNGKIVDGSEIRNGHQLIGIASSGLHSNGYSLVRKICFDVLKMTVDTHVPELGRTIGEELLEPTRIYVESILRLIKDLPIHGLAHITGGGMDENIIRIIPQACKIVIRQGSWEIPPVFPFLQKAGGVTDHEMMRTFNNGIGMVAVVPEKAVADVMSRLEAMNEKAYVIGEVGERKDSSSRIEWM